MTKEKTYYLAVQWCPRLGQTKEAPGSYFCGGWATGHPLTEVKSINCYTSRKRAERYAAKCATLNYLTDVIEVPRGLVREV